MVIDIRDTPLARDVIQQTRAQGYPQPLLSRVNARLLAEKHGAEFLGKGTESLVIGVPGTNRVEAIGFHAITEREAQQLLTVHRVLGFLFPYNIPRFYGVQGIPEGTPGDKKLDFIVGSVRQRIELPTRPPEVSHPFQEVLTACKDLPFKFDMESSAENVRVDCKGNEYYLDMVTLSRRWEDKDTQKVRDYMKSRGYPSRRQLFVNHWVAELQKLQHAAK